MRHFLMTLIVLLAVPTLSWIVMWAILLNLDSNLGGISSAVVCADRASAPSVCSTVNAFVDTQRYSEIMMVCGFALPAVIWITAQLIGAHRWLLAFVFPLLVRLALLALAVLTSVQGLLLISAIYHGESYFAGRVHGVLLVVIALGAALISLTLLWHALTLGRKLKLSIRGHALDRQKHAKIFGIVNKVARRLNARAPDNIVVGLDATFFATSANMRLTNGGAELTGETLYISLPLCRMLSHEELVGIISHELGHFRGKDTAYSLRFAPVYAGLDGAIASLDPTPSDPESGNALALPAMALLSLILDVFSRKEAKISQRRELAADKAATEVVSAVAFGKGLLKVALFAPLWQVVRVRNADRLRHRQAVANLSTTFLDILKFDLDRDADSSRLPHLLQTRIAHPTDSHPPLSARLQSLNLDASRFEYMSLFDGGQAHQNIVDQEAIEIALTLEEHKFDVASGRANWPREGENPDLDFEILVSENLYELGAAIVNSDGDLIESRLRIAEHRGLETFPSFDAWMFRERCRAVFDQASLEHAIENLRSLLNERGLSTTVEWLSSIVANEEESANASAWSSYMQSRLLAASH